MEELIYDIPKSIGKDIEKLEREQRVTNALLRAVLKSKIEKYDLPKNYDIYIQKSFLILCEQIDDAYEFSFKVAQRDGKNLIQFYGESKSDLAACITGMNDGDYLLIDNDTILREPEIQHIVLEAYQNNSLKIQIGKGPGVREVPIDIPRVNFIIFTDISNLFDSKIKRVFPIINEDCESDI